MDFLIQLEILKPILAGVGSQHLILQRFYLSHLLVADELTYALTCKSLKHAEHLHHFHAGTLRRLLEAAGFEIVHSTRRGAGKYVTPAFVIERSRRVAPKLAPLLARLERWLPSAFYVNPHDEWIVVARAVHAGE